jgi:hypothetical protein
MMSGLFPILISLVSILTPAPDGMKSCMHGRVKVEYNIPDKAYAKAVAKIVDFAACRARECGYDIPDQLLVIMELDPRQRQRLSTTGDVKINWELNSEQNLLAPSKSGTFHVYGLCHEVGHICQYRLIKERSWMTSSAQEGWATYYGYYILDLLFKKHGEKIWPDPHDYTDRGLANQLFEMDKRPDKEQQGPYLWHEFVNIVGEKGVVKVFKAINDAGIDRFNAADEVGEVLKSQKNGAKLAAWWQKARKVMVNEPERSDFKVETIKKSKLSRKTELLTLDDGTVVGGGSSPGSSGAAVRFEVGSESKYLTEVQVYGRRYGKFTKENFFIWLLDGEFKVIKSFPIPYSEFTPGKEFWAKFKTEPTRVPRDFFICVVFNAEARKGVYRYHDGSPSGASYMGVPGDNPRPYKRGDWLIRSVVQEKK